MMLTSTTDNVATTVSTNVWCGVHQWTVVSMRGSNRNQRVETLCCSLCGKRRRHVWSDWRQRAPKVIPLDSSP